MTKGQWTELVLLLVLLFMELILNKSVGQFFKGIVNIFKQSSS